MQRRATNKSILDAVLLFSISATLLLLPCRPINSSSHHSKQASEQAPYTMASIDVSITIPSMLVVDRRLWRRLVVVAVIVVAGAIGRGATSSVEEFFPSETVQCMCVLRHVWRMYVTHGEQAISKAN